MASALTLVFMHGTKVFLRLVIEKPGEFVSDDLCHAANWIIQQLRSEVPDASRVGYIYDREYFQGGMERETVLTTAGIYSILHECRCFYHHEVRFSVEEKPHFGVEIPLRTFNRHKDIPKDVIQDWFKCVEEKQKTFCTVAEDYLLDENDVSFTEFLKKLETRQKDIMKRFQGVSFSSSDNEEQRGIELGLEALTEDVFQPQLPCPDQEDTSDFFDTSDSFADEKAPLLASFTPFNSNDSKVDEEKDNVLDKMLNELLGKVDSLAMRGRNRRYEDHDGYCSDSQKMVADMTAELSKMEMEMHMEKIEKSDPRAKLSMTVATSTDIKLKQKSVPVETQTDKDSGSEDEIAIIRHALAVIQKKRKKMSTIGKRSPEMRKKKLRSSKSPKCSCCRKEKREKEERKEKVLDDRKKAEKEPKEKKKKEKKVDNVENWILGKPFPAEWTAKEKKFFDLMAELDKTLPTSSDQIDEPFNRKLREKWAHDGMKSLKKTTPIHCVRMPNGKIPNRFHRLQIVDSVRQADDEYLDKYNLARLDGKIYKLLPRFSGNTTPLNKNYGGSSTVPAGIHMAIVDESDPWLNWENHYYKVYRALNVGNRTLRGLQAEVIYSSNMEIARDLSKIPETVPIDYTIDFELLFNLIDHEKEGICVMQLKDGEGVIVSPSFAFIGKKIERPFSPPTKTFTYRRCDNLVDCDELSPKNCSPSEDALFNSEHRFAQALEEAVKEEEASKEKEEEPKTTETVVSWTEQDPEVDEEFEKVEDEKDEDGSDFELVDELE